MSFNFDSYQKRRLRSSYFSVAISIALVLFMVGFLGLVLLKSTQVANHFKEEVVITLFLKNDTSNNYAQHLDIWFDKGDKNVPYKFWFKVENLKLLPGSYNVQVSAKNISYFKNENVDVEYFIALEPESSYDV